MKYSWCYEFSKVGSFFWLTRYSNKLQVQSTIAKPLGTKHGKSFELKSDSGNKYFLESVSFKASYVYIRLAKLDILLDILK